MASDGEIAALKCELVQQPLRMALDYWQGRRATNEMPRRDAVQLKDLDEIRDHLALVDIIRGGNDFRFRLIGRHLVHGYRVDPTGRTLSSLPESPLKRELNHCYGAVLRSRAPVHYGPRLSVAGQSTPYMTEHLDLPLTDANGVMRIILAAVVILPQEAWRASLTHANDAA